MGVTMKKSKNAVINELESKLFAFTYDKGYPKEGIPEIKAACDLLGSVDPMRDRIPQAEESYENFRFRLRWEEEQQEKKIRRRHVQRRRLTMAAAVFCVLLVTANAGTYATREQSFFEVVFHEMTSKGITVRVTGNDSEFRINRPEKTDFTNWDDVEYYLAARLIRPKGIPVEFQLQEIKLVESSNSTNVAAKYKNVIDNKDFFYDVKIYDITSVGGTMNWGGDFELVEQGELEGGKIAYYRGEENTRAVFFFGRAVYIFNGDMILDDLREIVEKTILER